jgi:putative ABC transport system permease protein
MALKLQVAWLLQDISILFAMIRHILRLTLRDLKNNNVTALLNILGLAFALGSSFLILLYVLHENSFNSFHKEKDRICRVLSEICFVQGQRELVGSTSLLLADVLQKEHPEVELTTRVSDFENFYGGQYVKKDDQYIHEASFKVVDPSFFEMFSFPVISGDKTTFLQSPSDIVISEKVASKYFGNDNPVGKTLTIRNYDGERVFNVQGVFQDIPTNSTFQADLIGNLELTFSFFGDRGWGASDVQTYLLLENNQSSLSLEEKLKDFYKENHPDREVYYHIQSLKDIHFHSDHLAWYQLPKGNLKRIYLLAVIALIVLLIPCINYIILATGRGMNRYLEIGMRKVVGASKKSIFLQITSESVLLLTIALPFAIMISELMLPTFNKLLNTNLEIEYFVNLKYFCGLISITLIFGLLSGFYISLFLSRFQPDDILKLRFTSGYGNKSFRRILIVLQLIIFLSLFIFTNVLYKQLRYIEKKNLGFSPGKILAVIPPHDHHLYSCKTYVEAIKDLPGINAVSEVSAGIFTAVVTYHGFTYESNSGEHIKIQGFATDPHFAKTYGIRILEGRDLSAEMPTDSGKVLINETGIQAFGLSDPIGKMITDSEGEKYEIIGVISDFNIESLHEQIPPLIVMIMPKESMICQVAIKIDESINLQEMITSLKDKWEEFGPGGRFEYFYMDQKFSALYEDDKRYAKTFGVFTLLAIVLASLGLFGFSFFTSFQRIKEVGIRKAFGASTIEITRLILSEYILVILIANLISWPISWFLSKTWLQNFAYRTDIGLIVFFMAAALSTLILLLTIGYNTKKLAESNPVTSLNYE